MNLISAILLFSACTMCGFLNAYRLGARVRGIRALILDIKRIQSRMEYSSAPIARILEGMDTSPIHMLWSCMKSELNTGNTVYDAWRAAYDKTRRDLPLLGALHPDDIDALNELFSELGTSDMESQRQYFALFSSRMDAVLETAETESKSRGRVFRGLGALGGAALALLVI